MFTLTTSHRQSASNFEQGEYVWESHGAQVLIADAQLVGRDSDAIALYFSIDLLPGREALDLADHCIHLRSILYADLSFTNDRRNKTH